MVTQWLMDACASNVSFNAVARQVSVCRCVREKAAALAWRLRVGAVADRQRSRQPARQGNKSVYGSTQHMRPNEEPITVNQCAWRQPCQVSTTPAPIVNRAMFLGKPQQMLNQRRSVIITNNQQLVSRQNIFKSAYKLPFRKQRRVFKQCCAWRLSLTMVRMRFSFRFGDPV